MNYVYKIGDELLVWSDLSLHLTEDDFFHDFRVESQHQENQICYTAKSLTPHIFDNAVLIQKNESSELYETPAGPFLVFHWHDLRFAYGYYLHDLDKNGPIQCYFSPDLKKKPPINTVRFFSSAGLHSKLLVKKAAILHASYIITRGEAVLFTAPSGVGKSTQADLWHKYEAAEIVNGDRALIKRKTDGFYAFGYPCCGSSRICLNKTAPLRAIVTLVQSDHNEVQIPSQSEKMRILLSGIEVFRWLAYEIQQAMEIAEQIIREIPIYKLYCTPDSHAVSVLKNRLYEENYV